MVKKEKSAKLQINEERDEIRFDWASAGVRGVCLLHDEQAPKELFSATEDPKTQNGFQTCWTILLGARKFFQ